MPTMQLNGTRLEYLDRGAGDPVVLGDGTLRDVRTWEPQMDASAFPDEDILFEHARCTGLPTDRISTVTAVTTDRRAPRDA